MQTSRLPPYFFNFDIGIIQMNTMIYLKTRTLFKTALFSTFLAGMISTAQAGLIATSSDLIALIGASNAATENFGSANNVGSAYVLPASAVDNTNGLSNSDINFTSSGNIFQFDNPGYYGATSNELLANDTDLTLNFLNNTTAFGVDLRDFAPSWSQTAEIVVFGSNGTTILDDTTLSISSNVTFFGWADTSGISKVSFTNISSSTDSCHQL